MNIKFRINLGISNFLSKQDKLCPDHTLSICIQSMYRLFIPNSYWPFTSEFGRSLQFAWKIHPKQVFGGYYIIQAVAMSDVIYPYHQSSELIEFISSLCNQLAPKKASKISSRTRFTNNSIDQSCTSLICFVDRVASQRLPSYRRPDVSKSRKRPSENGGFLHPSPRYVGDPYCFF